jgi:signal peptide peptidase SppA
MTKKESSASYLFGGTSTVRTRQLLRAAAKDDDVKVILLHIDSPGGQVSGTAELADDVREAGIKKPVVAFIDDLGASAAYWVASQAGHIMVNKMGSVGSIGVFSAVQDSSQMAAAAGVKVHLITTGKYKGAGQPGVHISDAQLAEWQKQVDSIYDEFKSAVATGRALSDDAVSELADGRIFRAEEAKTLGLIDAVGSLDDLLVQLDTNLAAKPKTDGKAAGPSRTEANRDDPAQASTRPAKGNQMNLKELIGSLRKVNPEALAVANIDLDSIDVPGESGAQDAATLTAMQTEISALKADRDRAKNAALAQMAESFWTQLITPDANGQALATWAEKPGIVATYKALALLDGGGQLVYGEDGNFVVGPNLKAFMDSNLSRSKNRLQGQQIPDADPRGSNPMGIRQDMVDSTIKRLASNGRITKASAEKITGGSN